MKATLIVLRCSNLIASKKFYETLGLSFTQEQHGHGPVHYSGTIEGMVLELYPASPDGRTSHVGLGFRLSKPLNAPAGIIRDPDGNAIHLTYV